MYDGWLTLGGVELINSARAAQYAGIAGATVIRCAHAELPRALRDQAYTTPDDPDNPAPWWDAAVPASVQFCGVYGLSLSGFSAGTGGRPAVPLLADGSSVGPLRRGAREIRARVLLVAASEAGMSYGLAWLASALRGSVCNTGCVADELCGFAYLPVCEGEPPADLETDTCGDDAVRSLFDVGLLTGPTMLKRTRLHSGGWIAEVEFGLVAGQPYLWRQQVYITGSGQPGVAPAPPIPPATDCDETADCATDPLCPPIPAPVRPPVPLNDCYPGPAPVNDAVRTIVTVPAGQLPAWFEAAPILEIRTGQLAMRRITLRFYGNPADYSCADYVDPCTACAEINIPYLPANVTFRLDGRLERATVDCPGGPGLETADVEVYGTEGGLFEWPIFPCSSSLCVEVTVQASTVAPDSRVDVWMAAREDAA